MECEVCGRPLGVAAKYGVCNVAQQCRQVVSVRSWRMRRDAALDRSEEAARVAAPGEVVTEHRGRLRYQRRQPVDHTLNSKAFNLLQHARNRAYKKGLEFNLSLDWVRGELEAAIENGCPYLGIPIVLFSPEMKVVDGSPSIDRFDPSRGYTKDNCLIVSAKGNRIKNDATPAELAQLAAAVGRLAETRFKAA